MQKSFQFIPVNIHEGTVMTHIKELIHRHLLFLYMTTIFYNFCINAQPETYFLIDRYEFADDD